MAVGRRDNDAIISPAGRRSARGVGLLRLVAALGWGSVIVALGSIVDGAGPGALAAAGAGVLIAAAGAYGEVALGGRSARAEERRIRRRILARQFANVTDPAARSEAFPPSRMVEIMTAGTERVAEFRQVYLGPTVAALVVPLLTLTYVGIVIDPVVGFVTMALIPAIPAVIGAFLLAVRTSANFSQSSRGTVTARYMDVIRNLATIRLHNAGQRIGTDLSTQAEKNRATLMAMLARNQTMIMILDAMFSLVFLVGAAALALHRSDHLTTGEALTVVLLAVLLLEPLQQVAGFFFVGIGGIRGQKDIRGFYDAMPRRPGTAGPAPTGTGAGGVTLSGVTFDYGRGPVLEGVDLEVPAGGKVAIVGASGTGKSTLLNLIQGALPLQQGTIDVDAGPGGCASVSQTTWMFTGTIADNLAIADPGATEEQMWRALKLAHVADDISHMPHGLATHVGEGAALLSGGQAQRISLARGLLSGRRTLLLDEPTSQVDVDSENQIVDAIRALPRDWTVIIVTHRTSMLRAVDRVYRLEDGALTEARAGQVSTDA